jgi:hypothetical protein
MENIFSVPAPGAHRTSSVYSASNFLDSLPLHQRCLTPPNHRTFSAQTRSLMPYQSYPGQGMHPKLNNIPGPSVVAVQHNIKPFSHSDHALLHSPFKPAQYSIVPIPPSISYLGPPCLHAYRIICCISPLRWW